MRTRWGDVFSYKLTKAKYLLFWYLTKSILPNTVYTSKRKENWTSISSPSTVKSALKANFHFYRSKWQITKEYNIIDGVPSPPPLPSTCSSKSCYPGVTCENTPQGPRCGKCPTAYTGDGKFCKPILRCAQASCFPGNYTFSHYTFTPHIRWIQIFNAWTVTYRSAMYWRW